MTRLVSSGVGQNLNHNSSHARNIKLYTVIKNSADKYAQLSIMLTELL